MMSKVLRWQREVPILNAMPTADLLVRDSGGSNKGKDFGSHYLQLVYRHTLPLCSNGKYILLVNNRAKSLFDRRWGARAPLGLEAEALERLDAHSGAGRRGGISVAPSGGSHLIDHDRAEAVGKRGDPICPDPPGGYGRANNGETRRHYQHQQHHAACMQEIVS